MNAMLKKYISLPITLLVMALAITACNNELEQAEGNKDKVDVTLLINTRATDSNIESGEGIHTLRLIVTHPRTAAVEVNSMIPIKNSDTDPLEQVTFTLNGCEAGEHNFYLIANEASLSATAQEALKEGKVSPTLITTGNFPCLKINIPDTGLPMTAMKKIDVQEGMSQPTFDLKYLVSKIELTIHNSTGKTFNLSNVSFRHIAEMTSVFGENPIDLPSAKIYTEEMKPETSIDNGQYTTQTYYFYPTSLNQLPGQPLEIALNKDILSDSYEYTPVKPVGNADMSHIQPNQLVKINGTISSSGELQLICSVKPWVETGNDNESEWDYTNLVSFYSRGWDQGTNVTDDGVVKIVSTGNTLTFRIQSPKNATWSAELDYEKDGSSGVGSNSFEIDPSDGTVDGEEVSMKVTCPNEATIVKATLKITVKNAMNVSWPIFLFPSSDDLIQGSTEERRHYILSFSH